VGIDGVIATAERNIRMYIIQTFMFWVFQTKVEEQDEDELHGYRNRPTFESKKICSDLFHVHHHNHEKKKITLVIIDADSMIYIIDSS
jgi:hypothetical protein